MYVFNSFHFISLYVDERTRCMHSFGHRSVSFASINQSITSHQSHQQSFEPARKPPPNAYPATRCRPRDGRACTPSVSMRVPPSMRVPRVHTYPFHSPSRRSSTRRSGHVHGPRAAVAISPPLPHHTKNEQQKQRAPPSPCKNAPINTPRGRSSSYSTPPRVRPTTRAHPRARWITSDATSARRAGRVYRVHAPVTTHEKRRTHTDRAHPIGIGVVDAASSLESRVGSARRARAFDSLDALGRARALDTLHHRLLADRRASETSRARETRTKTPRVEPTPPTDGDDRRRTTTTRMSRYGRKGVDTVRAGASRRERDDRSARGGATSRVARGPARASTTTATEA